MFLNILKKAIKAADKPKVVYIPILEKVMVYAKITDCSKHYIVHNYKTNKREIVMKVEEQYMTEEEKKAIEFLKENIKGFDDEFLNKTYSEAIERQRTILNLIEKQQKEIEKEKRTNAGLLTRLRADSLIDRDNYWKHKIREVIKIIEKYSKMAAEEVKEKVLVADTNSLNYGRKEAHNADIYQLNKLLEE